jgi:hypothetical protein
VKNAPQVQSGALAANTAGPAKSLAMRQGAVVFEGEGWKEFEMESAAPMLTSFFQFHLTQEKLRQDSIVMQKIIDAGTVVACVAAVAFALSFGMSLVAKSNQTPAYYQPQSSESSSFAQS